MFKMTWHDPFGHLKHKKWSKERPKVKLSITFFIALQQNKKKKLMIKMMLSSFLLQRNEKTRRLKGGSLL
jgi:hypothetical protein